MIDPSFDVVFQAAPLGIMTSDGGIVNASGERVRGSVASTGTWLTITDDLRTCAEHLRSAAGDANVLRDLPAFLRVAAALAEKAKAGFRTNVSGSAIDFEKRLIFTVDVRADARGMFRRRISVNVRTRFAPVALDGTFVVL